MVLTSPYRRAVQTADALAAWLTPGRAAEPCDRLASGELDPSVLAALLSNRDESAVVLVGHMPDLAALTGYLIGGDCDGYAKAEARHLTSRRPVKFGTATLKRTFGV